MTNEQKVTDLKERFGLSSLNLWSHGIDGLDWIARAFRKDPKGFEASNETGGGTTIAEALASLEERLIAGPVLKPRIPMLDGEPRTPVSANKGASE